MRVFGLLSLALLVGCEQPVKVEFDSGGGETDAALAGELEVAPSAIDLPVLFVGQSTDASITVKNVGTVPVAVTVTVMGGYAADWTLNAYTSAPAPGETATHTASLTPTGWGDYSVSLLVTDTLAGMAMATAAW